MIWIGVRVGLGQLSIELEQLDQRPGMRGCQAGASEGPSSNNEAPLPEAVLLTLRNDDVRDFLGMGGGGGVWDLMDGIGLSSSIKCREVLDELADALSDGDELFCGVLAVEWCSPTGLRGTAGAILPLEFVGGGTDVAGLGGSFGLDTKSFTALLSIENGLAPLYGLITMSRSGG